MGQSTDFVSNDSCVSLFGAVWDTGIVPLPQGAKVLEIGCAEGDWQTPMLTARPDLQIAGIDWRACERPGTVIRGNVLTHDFPAASFDAVVCVSSIEHIGLGHYDADPLDPDGDRHAAERAVRWLKPGGYFYADVPYGLTYSVEGTSHRVYDDAALRSRLLVPGLIERRRWFSSWARQDHLLHDTPDDPLPPGVSYVALVAQKETA
jgi:SAM-dependent methyltransferase